MDVEPEEWVVEGDEVGGDVDEVLFDEGLADGGDVGGGLETVFLDDVLAAEAGGDAVGEGPEEVHLLLGELLDLLLEEEGVLVEDLSDGLVDVGLCDDRV